MKCPLWHALEGSLFARILSDRSLRMHIMVAVDS